MWRVVHQSGVGGKRVVVRRTRCDLVRIGRREAIRRQARTGRGLTRVRIERRNGEGLRERLHFRLAEADVLKAADRNQLHAVAGRADFLVDLEAALELLAVELPERAVRSQVKLLRVLVEEMCGVFRKSEEPTYELKSLM